jgi:hypothetical protein
MLVKHYAGGKFYRIALPEGSRLVRSSGRLTHDVVIVPYEGREIAIAADPPELLPLLAESGRCGLATVGEPEPEARLAGIACPECGERDVSWLSLNDEGAMVHCERCGAGFEPRREWGPDIPAFLGIEAERNRIGDRG